MKRVFFVLLLFSGQISLVRISQAKEIMTLTNAKKLAESPEACISKAQFDKECAFKTSLDEKYKFKLSDNQIVLDENTTLVRLSERKVRLVSGQIWIHAKSEILVETAYGEVTGYTGNFLVKNKDKRMDVKAIDSDLILAPKISLDDTFAKLKLEAGEQNWLGPVGQENITTSGMPLSIVPSELIVNWSRLYTGTKKDFEADFKNFFKLWSAASEKLAKFHSELTERQIAKVDNDRERKRKLQERQERENRRIKEWFRRRELSE